MESKLIVLKLFLDELEIPSDIETLDDRKRVQKAVYLGQLAKVDLGYRFGWYLKGPYCPTLTRDYYSLAEEIASRDYEYKNFSIKKSLKEKLKKVAPLLKKPREFPLEQEDWLELVASFDYLRRVQKLNDREANRILEEKKPHLARYKEIAEQRLKQVGLVA